MILKQLPKDFIVVEKTTLEFDEKGQYGLFKLKKINYNTEDVITLLQRKLNVPRNWIGYCGLKDRNAITTQFISIKNRFKSESFKDVEVEFLGRSNKALSLGDLDRNYFEITVRGLETKDFQELARVPNFYDSQRFSENNDEIGELIVKRKYKEAVNLILQTDEGKSQKIEEVLAKRENDYVNALNTIPHKILLLYVHSYQSRIWNETVQKYLELYPDSDNIDVEVVGFGTRFSNKEVERIVKEILKEENISLRDFIVREIRSLSAEGTTRSLFCELHGLKVQNFEEDDLNKGKYKVKVCFELEKGNYATNVLKYLFKKSGFAGI